MNREHPSSERLQRDFDGELAPNESAPLRAHLAECLDCTAQQASLERLRSLVRMTVQADAAQLDSERMFAAIMQSVTREPHVNTNVNTNVYATDNVQSSTVRDTKRSLRNEVSANAPNAAKVQAGARVAPVHRLRRLNRAASAIGAVALAAGVLLMVNHLGNGSLDSTNEDTYEAAEGHSEVVQVDFGYNAGTVFDISLSDGSSVPVVWIDDDDDGEE